MPAAALELALPPGAKMLREMQEDGTSHALPVGPWADGRIQVQTVTGQITRQAWRISDTALTTLQLMNQLTAQLDRAGYETLLRCENAVCGGFDFRFALTVFPPPEIFVDLFDYRYLSAADSTEGRGPHLGLLMSRAGDNIYLQITKIAPENALEPSKNTDIVRPEPPDAANAEAGLLASLTKKGRVVLSDLEFATNDAALGQGPFASLTALADFLKADSGRRVLLVGHSDTVGGYDANITVSRQRARAVMQRLLQAYGVPRAQLEAEGAAYLAPIASNADAKGREANRRVEAVLLSGG